MQWVVEMVVPYDMAQIDLQNELFIIICTLDIIKDYLFAFWDSFSATLSPFLQPFLLSASIPLLFAQAPSSLPPFVVSAAVAVAVAAPALADTALVAVSSALAVDSAAPAFYTLTPVVLLCVAAAGNDVSMLFIQLMQLVLLCFLLLQTVPLQLQLMLIVVILLDLNSVAELLAS